MKSIQVNHQHNLISVTVRISYFHYLTVIKNLHTFITFNSHFQPLCIILCFIKFRLYNPFIMEQLQRENLGRRIALMRRD